MRRIVLLALIAFICSVIPSVSAVAVDLSDTKVFASTKIEVVQKSNKLSVYLETFRPNFDYWLTFNFPDSSKIKVSTGKPIEFLQNGSVIQVRMKTSDYLLESEVSKPVLSLSNENNQILLEVFPAPTDIPSLKVEGNESEILKLNLLLTPRVANGQYAMAYEGEYLKFFEKFINQIWAFREISEGEQLGFPSGIAKFTYLEKIELIRPYYAPGIWKFLDEDFETVGRVGKFKTFGQAVYPEGHGMTSSPSGNPVVMSYVNRKVVSSWLKTPFNAPILDCVFSELKNGTELRKFSVWDWMNSNREKSRKYLDAPGQRTPDTTSAGSPVDFCHSNSLTYSKELNSYIVSLRSLDLVMIIDVNLKNVKDLLYAKNARQHFARTINKNQISTFNNHTNYPNSKFAIWSRVENKWKIIEYVLPISVPVCGNAELLTDRKLWVAGGCNNFDGNTAGVLYTLKTGKAIEIARLNLLNSGGTYRVDLFDK
jgi:hypothetical protein